MRAISFAERHLLVWVRRRIVLPLHNQNLYPFAHAAWNFPAMAAVWGWMRGAGKSEWFGVVFEETYAP